MTCSIGTFVVPSGNCRMEKCQELPSLADEEVNLPVSCPRFRHSQLRHQLRRNPVPKRGRDMSEFIPTIGDKKLAICNRTSPAANASPSIFFQRAIVPSFITGEMAGILIEAFRANVPWSPTTTQIINNQPSQQFLRKNAHRLLYSAPPRVCAAGTFDNDCIFNETKALLCFYFLEFVRAAFR